MALHGYEEVDHTADIALRVWGEDFPALLRQAAYGLYHLMGIATVTGGCMDKVFTIPQDTNETILVDFLAELLYLAEEEGLALDGFLFEKGDNDISVRATGRVISAQERHIKAVTFHDLTVESTTKGVTATITFDV